MPPKKVPRNPIFEAADMVYNRQDWVAGIFDPRTSTPHPIVKPLLDLYNCSNNQVFTNLMKQHKTNHHLLESEIIKQIRHDRIVYDQMPVALREILPRSEPIPNYFYTILKLSESTKNQLKLENRGLSFRQYLENLSKRIFLQRKAVLFLY